MPIYGRFSAPYILHFLLYIITEFCLIGTCRKAQLVLESKHVALF